MGEHVRLAAPYAEPRQQREADFMGMYLFLGTETMLFGGLLTLVFAYRVAHPHAAAEAAGHLRLWLATANTAILLTSSLFVALAVEAARQGLRRAVVRWLALALSLGILFLALKGIEYGMDYRDGLFPHLGRPSPVADGPAALIVDLYFVATTLHALHMVVGLAVLGWCAVRIRGGRVKVPGQAIVLEMAGVYWHFVDIVWIFIFPVFYLTRA